jgi:methylated-DNA-[protein]-cysteine S-methyltransferase
MSYYIIQTPIGPIGFEIADNHVTVIDFNPSKKADGTQTELSLKVENELKNYLSSKSLILDIPIKLNVTPFQKKVLESMKMIPYGQTMSYQALAESIGIPKGSRAVGNACGANPLPLYYPCHRVIKSDGGLGGFSGGLSIKKQLLLLESKNLYSR